MARMLVPAALPLLMAILLVATATDNTDVTQITLKKTTSEASAALSSPPSSSSGDKTKVTPASSTTTQGFYKGMSREFVKEHNVVRARYGAPPLMWDKTLALYARRWANKVQGDCDAARHSDKRLYGESFFVGTNGTAKEALCSWEREEFIYNPSTNACTSGHDFRDCGHFAIMVNKDWRWVGCGRAPCTKGPRLGQFFISCSYTGGLKPNSTISPFL
ncbi:unnamed protein product [Alopecurus aequalis]